MHDPAAIDNKALQDLESARAELKRYIEILNRWANTLDQHWRTTVIPNMNGSYLINSSNQIRLDSGELPRVEQIGPVLDACQQWLYSAREAYNEIPATDRVRYDLPPI